jgi:hypothetical protein
MVWWYDFSFAKQRVRESTHSRSMTVVREAEQQRRRDLECGIHNITEVQQNRICALADIAEQYLADYVCATVETLSRLRQEASGIHSYAAMGRLLNWVRAA